MRLEGLTGDSFASFELCGLPAIRTSRFIAYALYELATLSALHQLRDRKQQE